MQFGNEQPFRFLIHDRDTKFSDAFDEVFRTEGIKIIRTPVQTANAKASAERWIRIIRADCLDRILILGRRNLQHVLRWLPPPLQRAQDASCAPPPTAERSRPNATQCGRHLRPRELLGGLIHEYRPLEFANHTRAPVVLEAGGFRLASWR